MLSRVLRKTIQLSSRNQNESNEDYYNEEEQQEEVDMKTENPDRSTYAHLAITFAKNLSCLNVNEQVCMYVSIYSSIYSIFRMHVCMYSVCMCKCVYQ